MLWENGVPTSIKLLRFIFLTVFAFCYWIWHYVLSKSSHWPASSILGNNCAGQIYWNHVTGGGIIY